MDNDTPIVAQIECPLPLTFCPLCPLALLTLCSRSRDTHSWEGLQEAEAVVSDEDVMPSPALLLSKPDPQGHSWVDTLL